MTPAQRRACESANPMTGQIYKSGYHDRAWHAWYRMMQRLLADGLVSHYPHGGFQLTDAGSAALRTLIQAPKP